jgi:hypothetical protein
VYLKQPYVIKFVSDLRKVCDFLRVLWFPVSSTNKTDRHNITEIVLKQALNTITPIIEIIMIKDHINIFSETIYSNQWSIFAGESKINFKWFHLQKNDRKTRMRNQGSIEHKTKNEDNQKKSTEN